MEWKKKFKPESNVAVKAYDAIKDLRAVIETLFTRRSRLQPGHGEVKGPSKRRAGFEPTPIRAATLLIPNTEGCRRVRRRSTLAVTDPPCFSRPVTNQAKFHHNSPRLSPNSSDKR